MVTFIHPGLIFKPGCVFLSGKFNVGTCQISNMIIKGWKYCLLLISLLMLALSGYSQVTKLVGEQIRISDSGKVELKCIPVKITKTMQIDKVTGNNDGFWIQKDSETIYKFKDMKEPIGIKLNPGTYYVYPNLKANQREAQVEVSLH
ncbi:MAG: hypothetical protein A2W85_06975 [Bacteroidetes bacterium GWF2_41_31]|nr:MAG: hypothetical protein A2W85_06975 [Bacteroidetes bacterium GWF2_41_31]